MAHISLPGAGREEKGNKEGHLPIYIPRSQLMTSSNDEHSPSHPQKYCLLEMSESILSTLVDDAAGSITDSKYLSSSSFHSTTTPDTLVKDGIGHGRSTFTQMGKKRPNREDNGESNEGVPTYHLPLFTIKGESTTSEAVVCTNVSTFGVRRVEFSNSLYILDTGVACAPKLASRTIAVERESFAFELYDTRIRVEQILRLLLLSPPISSGGIIKPQQPPRSLTQMLPYNCPGYLTRTEFEDAGQPYSHSPSSTIEAMESANKPKMTFADLVDISLCSRREVAEVLTSKGAVMISNCDDMVEENMTRGYECASSNNNALVRLLDPSWRLECLEAMLVAIAGRQQRPQQEQNGDYHDSGNGCDINKISFDKEWILSELSCLYPPSVLCSVMDEYTTCDVVAAHCGEDNDKLPGRHTFKQRETCIALAETLFLQAHRPGSSTSGCLKDLQATWYQVSDGGASFVSYRATLDSFMVAWRGKIREVTSRNWLLDDGQVRDIPTTNSEPECGTCNGALASQKQHSILLDEVTDAEMLKWLHGRAFPIKGDEGNSDFMTSMIPIYIVWMPHWMLPNSIPKRLQILLADPIAPLPPTQNGEHTTAPTKFLGLMASIPLSSVSSLSSQHNLPQTTTMVQSFFSKPRWAAGDLKGYICPLLDPGGHGFDAAVGKYCREHRTSSKTQLSNAKARNGPVEESKGTGSEYTLN